MLNPHLSDFLSDFKKGTHAVLFYDTPENKREVLFNHLKYGHEGNEGLAYVCSEENPHQIRGEMMTFGLDADNMRSRNRLEKNNYDSVYIEDGEVNIPKIAGKFKDLAESYAASGLNGLRAAAEMSCFFQYHKEKELMSYEYALHRRLSMPAEGICAYNVRELTERNQLGLVMDLVRAHDPVIFTGPVGSLILSQRKSKGKTLRGPCRSESERRVFDLKKRLVICQNFYLRECRSKKITKKERDLK